MGCPSAAFRMMCKAEGIAVTRVMAELKERKLHMASLRGREYMARRMEELGGRATRSPVRLRREQAWLAWAKRGIGHHRIVDGVEEANVMRGGGRLDCTTKSAPCAALATEDQLYCYPANDAPAAAVSNIAGTSCFLLSFVYRATERRSSQCPAPKSKSGAGTSCPVLLVVVVVVVCGAEVCGGDSLRRLRGIGCVG